MDYDIDCIVINLDRDKERWQKIHNNLDVLGVSHRRFSAIDGRTMGDRYDALMTPLAKHFTCYGVLGCALSHKVALRDFLVHSDSAVCLLLEDDAMVEPGAVETINMLLRLVPAGWDMLKLASMARRKNGAVVEKHKYTLDGCAQLFSRAGAEKITRAKIVYPSYPDLTPWFIPGLEVYTVREDHPTFRQNWETSSLADQRYPSYRLNLRLLRIGSMELALGDLLILLFFVLVLVLGILFYFHPKKSRRYK